MFYRTGLNLPAPKKSETPIFEHQTGVLASNEESLLAGSNYKLVTTSSLS